MQIDEKVLRRVAEVARIHLTDEEINALVPEVKEILDAFSKLDEVDITNTESSFQPVVLTPNLRDDTPEKTFSQDEALSNTAHKKDGYFMGPRVV